MENIKDLLALKAPSYRKAYSDRTCWLMSCLSEIAYIRFNPFLLDTKAKDRFLSLINPLIDETKTKKLVEIINSGAYDHEKEVVKLNNKIKELNLDLLKTFDKNGTQAILVGTEEFIILAFRGTESTSIQDIKADCKAFLTICDSGGKIHSGFNDAYLEIAAEIEEELTKHDKPLFITGHSLGGALATVAAKKLKCKFIAACYTFGAPRAGNENWIAKMKTPIYRIVNAADCVTMVPPPGWIVGVFAWLLGLFSLDFLKNLLLNHFGDYAHGGDMRYLTNCAKGDYDEVQLLYSVSIMRRLIGWFKQGGLSFGKKFITDHKISIYRKKLEIIARRRNLTKT